MEKNLGTNNRWKNKFNKNELFIPKNNHVFLILQSNDKSNVNGYNIDIKLY